ncbi:MAG: hypothetical protein EPO40_31355 [Myxococcaceae bacterium]|nr:MAG: hypothetical protein EPO40_31355 [Myxococcaceae bacterium]
MRRAVAAVGWVVLAAGCEQSRTELVARVDSEVAWGAGRTVQSVTLTVRRGGPNGPLRSARTTALGAGGERRPLPLLVGIVPTDDTDTPVWIEALGCGAPNGCTAATAAVVQRAVVRFAVGQTQEVPLLLASACVGVTCGSDERCGATGRCEPATRATVRPFNGTDAATGMDVGVDRIDAATPDRPVAMDRTVIADSSVDVATMTGDTGMIDIALPVDARMVDLPAVDTPVTCGPLELRCGGACVAALRDPMNCGDCGAVCPAVTGATASCMGGRCGYACDAAHADCDERPSNGCESERATDHANCGTCGRACTDRQECRAGVCVACGGALDWCAGLGCIDTATDRTNCGGCGRVCPTGFVCQGASCVADRCTPASMPPDAGGYRIWLNCPAGCVDTESDTRNCGWCGHVCPPENATCSYGGCRDGICPQGYRLLPAGSFMMGGGDAGPVHRVTFTRPSCIMDHEVTAVEYSNCRDPGCVAPTPSVDCPASVMNWPIEGHDWQPVNCLPWSAADAYCRTQGIRLPTEAEWEYAARGTDGRTYPWGNTPPSIADTPQRLCWNRGAAGSCDWREFTAGASGFHAFHMAGNLAEWVSDWHGGYPSGDQTDPRGPSSGTQRVLRGGSWRESNPSAFTTTSRGSDVPTARSAAYGFRCVWTP